MQNQTPPGSADQACDPLPPRRGETGRRASLVVKALVAGVFASAALIPCWFSRLPNQTRKDTLLLSLLLLVPAMLLVGGIGVVQSVWVSRRPGKRRPQGMTWIPLALGWLVVAQLLLVLDVPLRMNLILSRPRLEERVRMLDSGGPGRLPAQLGGFRVTRIYRDGDVVYFDLGENTSSDGQLLYAPHTPMSGRGRLLSNWYWELNNV